MRPEQPARVTRTAEHLRSNYASWRWELPQRTATDEILLRAHTQEHLERLEQKRDFDPDTPYFPGIGLHARRAVDAALSAANHAFQDHQKAFSLMRPPGHHAMPSEAMGFCYLNQVAIAALAARRDLGAQRVAIWDFDAHHGNGTEAILEGREGYLFCSVHQSPCYPGTGHHSSGNCRNWPVAPGASREFYMGALRESLDAISAYEPELVLVSAGFDGYARDPIAQMTLELEDFASLGTWLRQSGLPAAAILEGGYSPDLPELVGAFLESWEG
jgi:acetoin utilization deacetylase AcuC-like enzyme